MAPLPFSAAMMIKSKINVMVYHLKLETRPVAARRGNHPPGAHRPTTGPTRPTAARPGAVEPGRPEPVTIKFRESLRMSLRRGVARRGGVIRVETKAP